MSEYQQIVAAALEEAATSLDNLRNNAATQAAVVSAARRFVEAFQTGGRVYSCGNGGSMCDGMHFAEELTGKFRNDRRPLAAMSISDAAHMSCTLNDYGPEHIFSRFVEAHGRAGDGMLAISTSGKSANVIMAAKAARARGMFVVALTGRPGSELAAVSDIEICTPGGRFSDRVQELHIKVIHILIELIEAMITKDGPR